MFIKYLLAEIYKYHMSQRGREVAPLQLNWDDGFKFPLRLNPFYQKCSQQLEIISTPVRMNALMKNNLFESNVHHNLMESTVHFPLSFFSFKRLLEVLNNTFVLWQKDERLFYQCKMQLCGVN